MINSRLTRKRDERIRQEDELSVAAALYGEILLLRRELAYVGRSVAKTYTAQSVINPYMKFNAHFLESNKLSDPMLYKALAPKIGLLNAELIIPIIEFYSNLEETRRWLPQLIENADRNFDYDVRHVLDPVRDAVQKVKPALRKIEGMVGISKPAGDPDLANVESVIEYEEDRSAA